MLQARGLDRVVLEVDGGVNTETIVPLAQAGVNTSVVGSALFGGKGVTHNWAALQQALGNG
jgi:pentose-5-phosphate-3-epimerase